MGVLKRHWWKGLALLLLAYSIVGGLLLDVPRLAILNETIRALYFHVPMWFAMTFMMLLSVIYAVMYMNNPTAKNDAFSEQLARVGVLMGMLGIATGMVWAKFTWGAFWSNDPKQNSAAIGLLIYFAYFILRGSMTDEQQRARISATYNVFAFVLLILLLFVLPRMTSSLHPGNGGNPGFNAYDLDSKLRLVFYPAVLGWILMGLWVARLRTRLSLVETAIEEEEIA
ncbi:heme exporter protein C [Fulvitalea axinellae]|uniref:Heme exporter protein C n=1 Tax=Fulvitalea axinellae TaxID=1182444 RepID=A0AAU9CW32_9BACT|nr:heme exporter protein C [Fulvitalea axinellae]